MVRVIENIYKLMSVIVIWIITVDYLSAPNSTMISVILCFFSIIIPLRLISNCMMAQKKSTNYLSSLRNPK